MKPSKEIIGLRIISISDGTQVGIVKDIILNPQEKTLDFIIVDQPTDYFGAKVIAFKDLLGMGEFAVTIPHFGVIQDVAQVIDAQNLLKQDTRVIGTKVLTKKGQLIGETKEIVINEDTGQISACLFEANGQMKEIKYDQIITLGRELLIVESDVPSPKTEEIKEQIQDTAQEEIKAEIHEEVLVEKSEYQALVLETSSETPVDNSAGNDLTEEAEARFNLFEQRQLQYFIGKRTDKNIILDKGEVLKAGEIITPECVAHITSRSILMEITAHLQKTSGS